MAKTRERLFRYQPHLCAVDPQLANLARMLFLDPPARHARSERADCTRFFSYCKQLSKLTVSGAAGIAHKHKA